MTEVFLSLGSNVGDKHKYLADAAAALAGGVEAVKTSAVYKTQPWGNTDQASFLNLCIRGYTDLKPAALLEFIKSIEAKLGRIHTEKWGPREIDIDILFYNDQLINLPGLEIPHPYLAERAFVLVPLSEIAPDFVHPVLKKSVSQLVSAVDITGVERLEHAQV